VQDNPVNRIDPSGHLDLCVNYVYLDGQKICKDGGGANSNISDPRGSGGRNNGVSNSSVGNNLTTATGENSTYLDSNRGCNQLELSISLCNGITEVLTDSTVILDFIGLAVSMGEAAASDFMIAATVVLSILQPELSPSILEALQFDVYMASAAGSIENTVGFLSLGTTALNDWLVGNTYIDGSGVYLGNDTIKAARNSLLGLIPESNIDLLVSGEQFGYDLNRINGYDPGGTVRVSDYKAFLKVLFSLP
jgi:hypothetical protein